MQFVLQQVASLDFWTFVVALLALITTVWFGYKQLKQSRADSNRNQQNQAEQLSLAREAASWRPALDVDSIDMVDPYSIRQVKQAVDNPEYEGPYPDLVLTVMLINKGKDPALEISGQLFIKHPLYPFNFPGLPDNITIHQVEPWLHIVRVRAPDDFKLRHGANFDRLGFAIALQVKTQRRERVGVKYIFTPANGETAEDTEYFDIQPARERIHDL